MPVFGEVFTHWLIRSGLSQSAFAKAAGCPSAWVNLIIRGQRTPPLDRLDAWANILKIPPASRADFEYAAGLAHCPPSILDRLNAAIKTREAILDDVARAAGLDPTTLPVDPDGYSNALVEAVRTLAKRSPIAPDATLASAISATAQHEARLDQHNDMLEGLEKQVHELAKRFEAAMAKKPRPQGQST